jgi:hypothetical protein
MKRRAAVAACVLLLAGCDQGPAPARTEMHVSTELSGDGNRVTVTRLSRFSDNLAYDNERGVYLIRDNETGQEFIGISGIGISELGSHRSGKRTVGDER